MTSGLSLREQLERKARRTAILPIVVGDAVKAQAAILAAYQSLQAHIHAVTAAIGDTGRDWTAEETAERDRLQAAVDAADAAGQATIAYVEVQALDAADWDAVWGPLDPDEEGDYRMEEIHAVALAASCTDPQLQDAAWWAGQLARPEWSKADRAAISQTLLDLNLRAPTASPGKG